MDKAARELKLGQDEIRKRNFVTAAEMPYSGGASLPFDSGDLDRNITDAFNRADVAGVEARRAAAAKEGKLLGQGVSHSVARTAAGMSAYARISSGPDSGLVTCW